MIDYVFPSRIVFFRNDLLPLLRCWMPGHRRGAGVLRAGAAPPQHQAFLEERRQGTLDRARSRLYRSEILQENMRLKALAEIYTMHSFALL